MSITMNDNSVLPLAVSVVSVVATSIYVLTKWKEKKGSSAKENVPPTAPKSMLETLSLFSGKDAPFFMLEMMKTCNSAIYKLNLPIPGGVYVIGDYQAQREVLMESDKPMDIYRHFHKVGGRPNIFTRATSDPMWKVARKGSAPAFSSKEISRMNQVCNKHLEEWIETTLKPCVDNGTSFDPSVEMTKLTFFIIMESAFEYTSSDEEYQHLNENLEITLREFTFKQATNPLRATFGPLIPEVRRAYRAGACIREFCAKVLQAYRANPQKSDQNTLIKLIENMESFDDAQKVSEIATYIVAGHDTTGFSLSTALVLLAQHPQVAEKVHESLQQDSSAMSATKPSEYLQYVMNESQRLVPVAATGSARQAGRDFVFETTDHGMVRIPQGAVLLMPQMLPFHDPSIFAEPEIFRPERWSAASEDMKKAFMMFSLGKRNCVGQSLAMAEMNSVLPRLSSQYKFEIETAGELDYFLTLKFLGARLRATRITSK
eukprot:scaffold482_cov266-Amphora_coffeaeformis.AAC.52